MDERRLLLAVALSLLVLTAYSLLFPAAPPPAQPPVPAASQPLATPAPAEAGGVPSPVAPSATPVPAVADERERRVEVSGPDFTVAFSNRGARLVSWTLGRYKDARGAPEEMVPAAGAGIRPLDIETGDGRRRRAAQGSALPCVGRNRAGGPGRPGVAALRVQRRPDRGREEPRVRADGPADAARAGEAERPRAAGEDPVGPRHRQPLGRRAQGPGLPGAFRRGARPRRCRAPGHQEAPRGGRAPGGRALARRREPLLHRALRGARGARSRASCARAASPRPAPRPPSCCR